jgi:hypothetical protein
MKYAVKAAYLNWFGLRWAGEGFYNRDIIWFTVHHLIKMQKPKDQ